MDGKPRRRPALSLIAATLAGQAVITIGVVVALTVMNAPGSPRPTTPRLAVPAPAMTPQSPYETVPPYYAALTSAPAGRLHAADITIRDTMSGKVLATLRPPAPYTTFSMVAATGSASAYIVAASQVPARPQVPGPASGVLSAGQAQLYLLVFNPVTRNARIGRLPVPTMDGLDIWGAALSPDNSQLAVAVQPSESVHQIRVYALARAMTAGGFQASGTLRGTWTATGWPALFAFGEQPLGPQALSWSADDRTLAFNWQGPGGPRGGLRLLDTGGTGGSLIADSRLAVGVPGPGFSCLGALVLTGDGETVFCGGVKDGGAPDGHPIAGIAQFSVATGKLVRQFAQPHAPKGADPGGVGLLWTSPTGSVVVAGQWHAGRLTAMSVTGPGYTRAIPRAPGTGQVAW